MTAVEVLARVRSRVLEREGIAMVLGVFDRRDGVDRPVGAAEPVVAADGADLADALDTVLEELHPGGDPGTEAALIDALAVLGEDRVKAPVSAVPHSPLRPLPSAVEAARRRRAARRHPARGLDAGHTADAMRAGSVVRVVNWHNTPASERDGLRRELAWYLERFDPLLPEDLDRFTDTGRWHRDRPGFIPAFYDGYLNNATVAAPVCDELGLRAWFYPPTAFLDVTPERQRDWAGEHDIDLLPEEHDQPALAMTREQLADIARRHVVAAHTATHATLASCVTAEDVEREVLAPARLIEDVTGRPPPAMAWKLGAPFDPDSVGGRAMVRAGIRYAVNNTAIQRIG